MAAWVLLALAPVAAGVMLSFASYYGDHMVLQKEPAGAVVWGYGEPGAAVTVTLSRDGGFIVMKKMVQVKGPPGTWTTVLDPMDQGGPYTLTAGQGSENVTLQDIYFGDVWLCSGQSNMAMTVLQIANASQELVAAAHYPYVRIFAAAPARSNVELEDLERIDLLWSIPTAENLGHGNFTYFSAVCWLLGRYLYEALQYPIGLVEAAWGGTPIEAWSSRRALQACGLPEDMGSMSPHWHLSGPQTPSVLWNAMIHPLLNMTLRGVAWYQGEANAFLHTDRYNCTFPALIADWRQAFHTGSAGQTQPLLPFGFVQLSTYRRQSPHDSFTWLRWHQTADLGVVPNAKMPGTFMAVAMDLCDEHSPYGRRRPPPGQAERGPPAAPGCQGCSVRGERPGFPGAISHPRRPGGDQGSAECHLQPGARLPSEGHAGVRGLLLQPAIPVCVAAGTHGGGGVPHGDAGCGRLREAGAGLALRLGRVALRVPVLCTLQQPGAARTPFPPGHPAYRGNSGALGNSRREGAASPPWLLVLPGDLGEGDGGGSSDLTQSSSELLAPCLSNSGRQLARLLSY